MEGATDTQPSVDVFENDIEMYLTMFCEENGIEDMKNESQSVWNGALMYIKRHVFNNSSVLKSSTPLSGYNNNNYNNQYSNLNNSNCNSYNIDIVNSICDYYIYLCMMYNKEISINGFTFLTGISQDCIYAWGNNTRELSTSGNEIYKKLNQYREESLSNKLVTGNKNPVGVIAILNRQFGWASPYTSDSRSQNKPLPANELPTLGNNTNNLSLTDGQITEKQTDSNNAVVVDVLET